MFLRKIFLSWRPGPGSARFIVGRLKRNKTKGVEFKYFLDNVKKAEQNGFTSYPEFPVRSEPYTNGVLEIFSRRLTRPDRADRSKVLDFWNVDQSANKYDSFDLLALTQGWLTTDNFEFLGVFHPKDNFKFVTDLARVGAQNITRDTVKVGDRLTYEYDKYNTVDSKAIKVFKGELMIGFIKQKHCNYFHDLKKKYKADLVVKAVDQNGIIKQIFISVGT